MDVPSGRHTTLCSFTASCIRKPMLREVSVSQTRNLRFQTLSPVFMHVLQERRLCWACFRTFRTECRGEFRAAGCRVLDMKSSANLRLRTYAH